MELGYLQIPGGSTFALNRAKLRFMLMQLFSPYTHSSQRSISHIHLQTPITGITLSDTWTQLPISNAAFTIKTLDGFSFDSDNDRVIWDGLETHGSSVTALFIGDAGMEVTAGLVSTATISLGLFIDGVLTLETPLTFAAIDKIQGYGANGILVDSNDVDLLQSGSYYEFFAKAGAGETPTVTLSYFQTTIKRD